MPEEYNPFLSYDEEDVDPKDTPFGRALHNVAKTEDGRALIWAILSQAKIYTKEFNGNSGDIHNNGKRSVGLWLIDAMNEQDATMYPRMLLEVAKKYERDNLATSPKSE